MATGRQNNWRLLGVMLDIAALAHSYGSPNTAADSIMHMADIQYMMWSLLSFLS